MRRGKPDCPGTSPTAPRNLAQLRAPKVGRPILQRFPKAFSRGSSRATGREGSPSTALECTPCRARGATRGKGPSEPGTVALRHSVEFGRDPSAPAAGGARPGTGSHGIVGPRLRLGHLDLRRDLDLHAVLAEGNQRPAVQVRPDRTPHPITKPLCPGNELNPTDR